MSSMERDFLEEQLAAGRSLEQIGAIAGKHASTVGYWLKKYGLVPSGHARHAPRGSVPRRELEELVSRDLSVREIARALGRSPTTVRHWIGRYGLATTDRARRKHFDARKRLKARCPRHGETTFIRHRKGPPSCARCRADSVTAWRRRAKAILVAEAGGSCAICGYSRCVGALEFHHVDPTTKRFALGGRGLSRALERLREEASKCVLLCSNCHVEIEMGMAVLPATLRPAPASAR